MKKKIALLVLLIGLVVAAFAPVIPDTFFVRYGKAYFEAEYVATFLSDDELAAVLTVVRKRGHYGSWAGSGLRTQKVSLLGYFFLYPRLGILAIGPVDLNRNNGCITCTVWVNVGVVCGGLCGYGAIFYLEKLGSEWIVRSHSSWVS